MRTGTLILAWIYVISSVLSLIGAGTTFGLLEENNPNYDKNQMFNSLVFLCVVASLQLLLAFLLLIGATQNKPNLLLPYLWLQAILLVLNLINVIWAFVANWRVAIGSGIGWRKYWISF